MAEQTAPLRIETVATTDGVPPPERVLPEERQTPEQKPEPADPISRFASLIGPLASSLAIIGGVLYASGYLISVAQSRLLGLGRLVAFSQDYYVQQGGSFLVAVGTQAMQVVTTFVWGIGAFLLVLALPASGCYALHRWTRVGRIRWWPERFRRLTSPFVLRWRCIVYAILLGLLFWTVDDPESYSCPLLPSNILFMKAKTVRSSSCQDWTLSLLVSNGGKPAFEARLHQYIWLVVLFFSVRFVVARWDWKRASIMPFAIMLLLYTLSLPMLYGVLRAPVEFPEVEIRMSDNRQFRDQFHLLLLNKGEKEFVLFAASQRKVIWLRQDLVENIEVKGSKPILDGFAVGEKSAK